MRQGIRSFTFFVLFLFFHCVVQAEETRSWVKVRANDKEARNQVVALGVSIETIASDYVMGIATRDQSHLLREKGLLLEETFLKDLSPLDFPSEDAAFHNYDELSDQLKSWASANPDFVELKSLGKSLEGREIWRLRLSTGLDQAAAKPGIVFLGGHHAREHISVETPLKLAEKLITGYKNKDPEIVSLIKNRDVHIVPTVNPDGKEHDIGSGHYRYWRKNRAVVNNVVRGVDLNRNYGFGWGGAGSSSDSYSEIYRGPSPFSEPETQAIKKFIEEQTNITILLSFHTFSQLILYPWGHKDDRITDQRDYLVHKTMAETMAQWNGYRPQQSSELYVASGDTTDWSYGDHKIISFTFELDPGSMFEGGFYPGADQIDVIFEKNWRPCLYLMGYADNPYRVLEPSHARFGLNSALIE